MAFINLGQVMWPVGSIYISENNTSPGSIFGGNWEELNADACLMATGENGAATYTGSKKITIDQMPKHAHATHWSPSGDESKGYGLNNSAFFKDRPCVYQTEGRQYGTPVGGGQDYLPYSFKCHIWKRKQDA